MYLSEVAIAKSVCLYVAATVVCLCCIPPQPIPPSKFSEKYNSPSTSPEGEGRSTDHPAAAHLSTPLRSDYAGNRAIISYTMYPLAASMALLFTLDVFHTLDLFPQIMPVEHTTAARVFNGQLIVGLILSTTSSVVRLIAFQNLGRFFTFTLSILPDHKLITHGLYSYIRHPSYAPIPFIGIGTLLVMTAPGSVLYDSLGVESTRKLIAAQVLFTVGIVCVFARRADIEDEVLRKEFGKEWEEWARVVRYKFIPGVL